MGYLQIGPDGYLQLGPDGYLQLSSVIGADEGLGKVYVAITGGPTIMADTACTSYVDVDVFGGPAVDGDTI